MVFNKVMNEDDIKNIIEMDYKEIKDSVVLLTHNITLLPQSKG